MCTLLNKAESLICAFFKKLTMVNVFAYRP
jgi:hypothetical protein